MKKHFPNFITLLNLFCGAIAIVFAFRGNLQTTSLFIGLGLLFDFLDGFAARLLNVKSEIGKELDSLADVITFGLAPGIIIYILIVNSQSTPQWQAGNFLLLPFLGLLIPAFAAYRLAKFNTDKRQEDVFYGLPTPSTAIFIGSLPLVPEFEIGTMILNTKVVEVLLSDFYFLIAVTIGLSLLMVSEIKLFSFKFSNFSWSSNTIRYSYLFITVLMFFLFGFIAFPLSIILYVLMSMIFDV